MGPHSQQNRFLLLWPIKWVALMDSGQIWPRAGFWTQIFFWQIFSLLWIKLCERRTFFHFWTRFFDIFSLFLKFWCTIVTQDLPNMVSVQNNFLRLKFLRMNWHKGVKVVHWVHKSHRPSIPASPVLKSSLWETPHVLEKNPVQKTQTEKFTLKTGCLLVRARQVFWICLSTSGWCKYT